MSSAVASIEACIPALRRYACALLRNSEESDDLVHESLVRALDRLGTRDRDPDVRAWLFTIMHNLFVSRLRKARVRGPATALYEATRPTPPAQEGAVQMRDVI